MKKNIEPKEIWPPHQAFYIQSMMFNADAALKSVQAFNALITAATEASPDNPAEALYGGRLLSELQNVVVHAAALSRYFWPVRASHQWRGDELREVFEVDHASPLKNRDLRNSIEHFDERLDTYLEHGIVGQIVPEYIGLFGESTGVPIHFFRAYYVDTAVFQLLDRRFDVQPIVSEVLRIHKVLLKMDQNGGTFQRRSN